MRIFYLQMATQVSIYSKPNAAAARGRCYRCLRCIGNPYEGEKSKVEVHIYKKHVALDQVPYFCNICKFVSLSQSELEKHILGNNYPTHKAVVDNMRLKGQEVNETESLLMNLTYYKLVLEIDYTRLSKEESEKIFSSRCRKAPQTVSIPPQVVNKKNDAVLRDVLFSKKVPEVCRSENSEHVLSGILGYDLNRGDDEFANNVTFNSDLLREMQPEPVNDTNPVTDVPTITRNVVVKEKGQNVEKHMEQKKSNSAGDVENVTAKDIEILKSDMKTVGTVLDKFLDQLGKSISSLDNATNNIVRALDRQTGAFNRLASAIEGREKDKENRDRPERQHFQRGLFQRNRSRSRSRSRSPVRRTKFMKY